MSCHDEQERILSAILSDFSPEELYRERYMLKEIKLLFGVSDTEANELLILARFKQQIELVLAVNNQS